MFPISLKINIGGDHHHHQYHHQELIFKEDEGWQGFKQPALPKKVLYMGWMGLDGSPGGMKFLTVLMIRL